MIKIRFEILVTLVIIIATISLGTYFVINKNKKVVELSEIIPSSKVTKIALPHQTITSTSTVKYSEVSFYKEGENNGLLL